MFTSVTPRAKFPGISELAGTLGLGSKDWERLTLSMPRDANTSELRIYAATDRAAQALLQVAQAQLDEVRASPVPMHQQTAAKFSVEAEDPPVEERIAPHDSANIAIFLRMSDRNKFPMPPSPPSSPTRTAAWPP